MQNGFSGAHRNREESLQLAANILLPRNQSSAPDLLGREVRTFVKEVLKAGSYETTFDASGLTSGYLSLQTSG